MTITAKFDGTCCICRRKLPAGSKIDWAKGRGATCSKGTEDCQPVPQVPVAVSGDLLRVVTFLLKQREAGKINDFQASLLTQFERKGDLSEKQIAAVLKRLDGNNSKTGAVSSGSEDADKTYVPDGRYAVQIDGEWHLFRIWRGTRDASIQHVYSVTGTERGSRVFGPLERAAVKAIAVDPGQAAVEFGHRTGSCSRCGLELEVNLSRHMGVGPVCAKHWFPNEKRLAMMADSRAALRAAGIDPLGHEANLENVA